MPSNAEREAETLFRNLYQRIRQIIHPHHWEHEPGGKDETILPLGFLRDVTITDVADVDVLAYDETAGAWTNQSVAEAIAEHEHALPDLSDVDDGCTSNATQGDILMYIGGYPGALNKWTNRSLADAILDGELELALGDLTDVDLATTAPADGDTLVFDADGEKGSVTGIWIPGEGGSGTGEHQAYFYVQLPGTVPPGPKNMTGGSLTITSVSMKSDGECAATVTGGSCNFSAGGGEETDSGTTTWSNGARLSVSGLTYGDDATYLVVDWIFS